VERAHPFAVYWYPVDVTSRTIDVKMLSAVQLGVRGLRVCTAQYAAIMLRMQTHPEEDHDR
jgi:hypothetical protein